MDDLTESIRLQQAIELDKVKQEEELELSSFPYPEKLMDEDGYPTQEALDYIKNWGYGFVDGKFLLGQYYKNESMDDLIDYIKSIWCYNDGIVYEDGLLEIHTLGWSGNEEIIPYLENTMLWGFRFRASQAGGHYYFRVDNKSAKTWGVQKVDALF